MFKTATARLLRPVPGASRSRCGGQSGCKHQKRRLSAMSVPRLSPACKTVISGSHGTLPDRGIKYDRGTKVCSGAQSRQSALVTYGMC